MKKTTLFQLSALFMALMITLSSLNIIVDFHYCKNEIKSVSFFGNAKTCKEMSTPLSCGITIKKSSKVVSSNCCHNESIVIKNIDLETTHSQSIIDEEIIINWFSIINYPVLVPFTSDLIYNKYSYYKPPLPDKNRSVLYQAFLL